MTSSRSRARSRAAAARHGIPASNDLATVRVKVQALADSHLVSAAQPLKWTGPDEHRHSR